MKKIISAFLVLSALLMLTLTACTGNNSSSQTPSSSSALSSSETESSGKVYDAAYNYFKNFPSDKNVIAPKDLFGMIDKGDEILILDIRRPEDYSKAHLKGAVNLSFFDMSIADNLEKLPDDRPIMVYCYTGQTSSQVTALLNIAGKTAKNVQSGYNNGISKAEGFSDAYTESQVNSLPAGSYAVDPVIKDALTSYFAEKISKDGTGFANFNISPKDVKSIVDDKNSDYLILSIRREEDYKSGHIPTASHIEYGQGMESELAKLPTDKKIAVYCYTGQTSSQATAVLRLMGYDAYSMSEGMGSAEAKTGWLGEGYEVVTD